VNGAIDAEICPSGDVDYFTFNLNAGQKVGIATFAQSIGSPLDTYLYLYDSDGRSILAENDDRVPGSQIESYLTYPIQRSGIYFLKVRAWDHPSAGGSEYDYRIQLSGNDSLKPDISILNPPTHTFLPATTAVLEANAFDNQNGISRVDFFWHSGDWVSGAWSFLSSDWDGGDGWRATLDTSPLAEQRDMAVYAQAYDWTGNMRAAASWNLWLDKTPPVSALNGLPTVTYYSTAAWLGWSGSDSLIGVGHYDLQVYQNGAWSNYLTGIPAAKTGAWYVGSGGQQASFRMRAVDLAGNAETYPSIAEATTTISSNFCSAGDIYENNNSIATAHNIGPATTTQVHTFCNPTSGSGWLSDVDWFRLSLQAGKHLVVFADPLGTAAAAKIDLYASNGVTLLAQASPTEIGSASFIIYETPSNQTAYLRVTHLDSRIAGDDVKYGLTIQQGQVLFLPMVRR
jgi:hypothetical protein